MTSRTSVHVPQLDGLRTVAIGMVLIAHWVQWRLTETFLGSFPFAHGVTLFFVLSGFLITNILLDGKRAINEGNHGVASLLRAFYIRRILRIFPIYYLLIGLLFIIDFENTRSLFPWLVTYTTNIYQSIHQCYIGSFNHFWSLAAEEQFYLFWPLLLLLVPERKIPLAILSMITVSFVFRACIYASSNNWMAIVYSTPGCMHALGLGALGSVISRKNVRLTAILGSGYSMAMAVGLYLALFFCFDNWGPYWYKDLIDEIVFAVACLTLVLGASTDSIGGWAGKFLKNNFIVYTGRISYGIYVYHLFIPPLVYLVLPKTGITIEDDRWLFPVFLVLTWTAAALSWRWIEAPLNRLKRHFPYPTAEKIS
jgi:peptidoglycan/LPS O-acetylase OafA/YrhL